MVKDQGKVEGYFVSPSQYERLIEAEEMLKSLEMIDKSMEEVKAGRTRPMQQALKDIAYKHNITIDR